MVAEGEGAFYAPKIDVHVRDAIGRRWQVSTIQVDFQMPQRFDLEYVGRRQHPPPAVHDPPGPVRLDRAVLRRSSSSTTRAPFPTWLAPVQVQVLPVGDAHQAYADRIADRLRAEGFRADVVAADESLGARIRKAKLEKLPYILVVGDDDVAGGTVGVNARETSRPVRDVPVGEFIAALHADVVAHLQPSSVT